MATAFQSDQVTNLNAVPRQMLKPADLHGRVRRAFFTKTLPGSGLAIADTIDLIPLPAGARVTGGQFCWDQTQGATATTAIGIAGATGKYFAAAVTASANVFRIADTQAQNYGATEAALVTLVATNAAAAWTASSVLKGHVDYVVD